MSTETTPKRSHHKNKADTTASKPKNPGVEKTVEPKIVVHERKKILAKYEFTADEKLEHGVEIGRITFEINSLEETAKNVSKDYKTQLDMKEASRDALAAKLSNGYEFREVEALITFRPKEGLKDFYHPFTKALIRTEEMTPGDFQLPMFRKEELEKSKTKKAEDAKAATPVGETNVGNAIDLAVIEAAKQQKRVEIDLEAAAEGGESAALLVREFIKAAKDESEWPAKIATQIRDMAVKLTDQGSGAVIAFLQPFLVQK